MRLLLILTAAVAAAQPQLAIRGTVREGQPGPPLAGVEVVLKEFRTIDGFVTGVPYLTAYTDARGEYEFKPERFGDYFLEARKPGYWAGGADIDAAESPASLSEAEPQTRRDFVLMQPGYLEGRVIDENSDPLPNHSVWIELTGNVPGSGGAVKTNAEGAFLSPKLRPGDYLVRVGPPQGLIPVMEKFTDKDAKRVDRDVETSYWPGGVTNRAAALPIRVPGGTTINAGMIRPRMTDRYRVRLRINGADCRWRLGLKAVPGRPPASLREALEMGPSQPLMMVPCAEELLATGLVRGPYRFDLTNLDSRAPESGRWASVDAVIEPDMEPISIELIPAVDIPVRFLAYEGVLPDSFSGRMGLAEIENGRALLKNVTGREYRVNAQLNGSYYVHSMRYGNQPVLDRIIQPTADAELEIVVDNRGATVQGTVEGITGNTFAGLFSPNATPRDILTGFQGSRVGPDGRFRIGNVPPGEYRAVALPGDLLSVTTDPDAFARFLNTGERITLQRGDSREIRLRLSR